MAKRMFRATPEKKKGITRVGIVSDLHCGSRAGLTPPDKWQIGSAYEEQQKKTWLFYENSIKRLKPIDILICNGDALDGKGQKSGGTELYETDRNKQVEIAEQCLRVSDADKYMVNVGTGYHTGTEEDFEQQLAWRLDTELDSHLSFAVNGTNFDITHHIGSSTVPHARFTALARAKLWNSIWALKGGQTNADIVIRSHVHYFLYCGDADWIGVITPALQGFGSKFGVRQCQGTVDFGLIWFDIDKTGHWDFGYDVMRYEVVKEKNKFESKLK